MTAHKNTRKSPFDMENPSVMHRKYIPAIARATPIHTFLPALLPRKSLIMGTISMYRAVINPAFPALVYTMPICWRELATARAIPQRIPPVTRVFLSPTEDSPAEDSLAKDSPAEGSPAADSGCPLFLPRPFKIKRIGSNTSPPMALRIELNVNGPR